MIVRSTLIANHPQRDGRRYVTERHETDTGRIIDVEYLAEAGIDAGARMLARVPDLEVSIEAERLARIAAVLRARALRKRDTWTEAQTDLMRTTTMGLTDNEVGALRRALSE